jgi:hypothetical protein
MKKGIITLAVILTVIFLASLDQSGTVWGLIVFGLIGWAAWVRANHKARHSARSRTVPQDVKVAVAARDLGRCRHCGDAQDLQYDHIIPFSLGGSSTEVSNIQLLCGTCNRAKSNHYVG